MFSWVLMASMVAIQPSRARRANNSRIAIFSFDFSAVALALHQIGVGGKGANQVQRRGFDFTGAPAGFAVNGDHLVVLQSRHRAANPVSKSRSKLIRVYCGKYPAQGVMLGMTFFSAR